MTQHAFGSDKESFFSPPQTKIKSLQSPSPSPTWAKKKETAFSYFCPLAILIIFVPAVSPSSANTAPHIARDTAATVEARVTIHQMTQNSACVFPVVDKRLSPPKRLRWWPGCWECFMFWPFESLFVWFQSENLIWLQKKKQNCHLIWNALIHVGNNYSTHSTEGES